MNSLNAQSQPHAKAEAEWHVFSSREECANALADALSNNLHKGVKGRGVASLVVSGGGTPVPMFQALKAKPLEWEKIAITLADERWVSAEDDESNEKLVRTHLLRDEGRFIPLKNGAATAEAGVATTEEILSEIAFPFDAVVLGMGGDGHTASLFPQHPALVSALDAAGNQRCMAVTDAPKPPPERITLTYPALLDSRHIFLHITGEDKKDVLEQALREGDAERLPIAAFLHQDRVPVSIYWAA